MRSLKKLFFCDAKIAHWLSTLLPNIYFTDHIRRRVSISSNSFATWENAPPPVCTANRTRIWTSIEWFIKREGLLCLSPVMGRSGEGFVAPKKNLSRTFLDWLHILWPYNRWYPHHEKRQQNDDMRVWKELRAYSCRGSPVRIPSLTSVLKKSIISIYDRIFCNTC